MNDSMQLTPLVGAFREVGLSSEKWLPVFKKYLGIDTFDALNYIIGKETYQLLVHFVSEPCEKGALRMLLKVQECTESYRDEQKQMLKKRQSKLKEVLKSLQDCQSMKLSRQHSDPKCYEHIFRGILEVAEDAWIGTDLPITIAISKMEAMHVNIESALGIEDHEDIKLLKDSSGGFGLEEMESLALRGLNPYDLSVHEKILNSPKSPRLGIPVRSQHSETLNFESEVEEGEVLKQIALFGCSIPNSSREAAKNETMKGTKNYYSTIKYIFVPMASCILEDHHLQLSDKALSQLVEIDKSLKNEREQCQIETQCKNVFNNFGSHSFRGPIHFGGVYMWKCSSYGFSKEISMIQKLHNDAIDALVSMHVDNISEKRCISDMKPFFDQHSEDLKKLTFVEVIRSGGPEMVVGFPDWKNCLLGSSSTWKLIDCGLKQMPIWDIIEMNNGKHFEHAKRLATIVRQLWKKLKCADPKVISLSDECVKGLSKTMETPFLALKQLLRKRVEVERTVIDPKTWASLFLTEPQLQDYLCSVIRSSDQKGIHKINGLLQELVEPTDLSISNVFSNIENGTQKVYETTKLHPPILQQHFISIQRFFQRTFQRMRSVASSPHEVIHPYYLMRGTAVIEMAVQMLQKYLALTGQHYEECLLLTLLHPLQYCPERGRFHVLLTKIDIEYLCINFVAFSEEYFTLMDQSPNADHIKQAYLVYLTVHVLKNYDANAEFIATHINYLKQKLKIVPEIASCLGEHCGSVWNSVKDSMEGVFRKGANVEIITTDTLKSHKDIIFEKLGLLDYFPQKLSLQDALQIREDTLIKPQAAKCSSQSGKNINPAAHAFIMVQKILSYDHRCRMAYGFDLEEPMGSDSYRIHPLDCLLALLHSSDNFLRQDLLYRLAACQLALPLLLPSPSTQEPTLLLWAMRSIVKEFKLPDDSTFSGRLITYPAPFVSFLRIGYHSMSKSEMLNGVIRNPESDNRNMAFIGHNYPGGEKNHVIANGLVEISWYLPGDEFYDQAIAFTNLRGDASDLLYKKQLKFLCEISYVHVVLFSEATLKEDGRQQDVIELINELSQAPGGVILVQTESLNGFHDRIAQHFDYDDFKMKINTIDYNTSSTIVCRKIQREIRNLVEGAPPSKSLETAAHKHNILIDEDDAACKRGNELADELYGFIEKHRQTREGRSPKDLLPLQSEDLWHQWAVLDKEQYRHKSRYLYERSLDSHDSEDFQHPPSRKMSSQDYSALQRKKMKKVRSNQYPLANDKINDLMKSFINHLRVLQGPVLWYYMTWLKFKLDDMSRKILPPFHAKIRNKRNELSGYQKQQDHDKEKKCHKELKALDKELINASFGLEHLLREVGQIYEAAAAQEDLVNNPDSPVASLPLIAAKLLRDGFPLEILDGEACHMPQKWISAVLSYLSTVLQEKLSCEPKIYVLSILGVQSTGKSTLLNTLFGVQFSVSAGRCTRGAFMQLIPVHKSLHRKLGVHYFLLVDTEGLRPPELDRLNAFEHDNELATFVVGIANLTLINISGEVAGDMYDILHTAVHAFLRMSQVSLKPSCHIVHQHVAAVGAEEKMMMGQFKTKDNLDNMTKAAAKETGLETLFTLFTDVIKFDHEKDVSFFPDLWNGMPPMARVSSGYSEAAQRLKGAMILNSADDAKYQSHSILDIKNHLESLWKAILQEDFVFSFQNTFEIVAFKTLDAKYGDWSWMFKDSMTEWERMAQNKLLGCTAERLRGVYQELLQSSDKHTREMYMNSEKLMNDHFDESDEILLKWKPDTEARLLHLSGSLKCHAQTHCLQLYQSQKGRAEAESKKEELSARILQHVQQLISDLHKEKMSEDDVIAKFEKCWDQWICDLTATIEPIHNPDIAYEVEQCMNEFFKAQHKFVHERLNRQSTYPNFKPLIQWGLQLKLNIGDIHINVSNRLRLIAFLKRQSSNYFPLAQQHTDKTLHDIQRKLTKISTSDENFKPQFVTDMLRIIRNNRKTDLKEFQFTEVYEVEMGLTACGYAIPVFEKMAEDFRRKHDPVSHLECVVKPHFKNVFLSKYQEVDEEKIAAETVVQQLEQPIKDCVMESLSSIVVNEMRGTYPWIRSKQTFIGKIMLDMGEMLEHNSSGAMHLCTMFITDAKYGLDIWARIFTEKHCDTGSPSRLAVISQTKLRETFKSIVAKIKQVSQSHSKLQQFSVHKWLNEFHAKVGGEINLPLGTLCALIEDREFNDAEFFAGEVVKSLEELCNGLSHKFSQIKYVKSSTISAHEDILQEIAGCIAQCPFCKAQCEHSNPEHSTKRMYFKYTKEVKHNTQHRPECLGNARWKIDNTMVMDICTSSVASDYNFSNSDTNEQPHPYRKYKEKYPDWNIPPDNSLESSLFWKWFVGHYPTAIEKYFGRAKTKIPDEWQELEWRKVKQWLTKEYNL